MKPAAQHRLTRRLTQAFSAFLRRRRRLRHFARSPLLEILGGRGSAQPAPTQMSRDLLRLAQDEPAAAIARLKSHPEGLSAHEARARLARHGPNEVAHEAPLPAWLHLWHCYKNPFNLLLSALALLSWFGADAKATVVIGIMVGLSTAIRFVQEGRSHRAAEGLKAMVGNQATVIRRGNAGVASLSGPREIALRELVPGDLVALSAGDMVPADGWPAIGESVAPVM